ncbi:unnamed protein product [Cylindrotheca closterium]|uniref:Transmembrane protein n=1 Tax=Cylindrotheca closterium TaxID=2856 RepID=A0AAD2FW35_9STRA|nr:unnamed protein product [Cylindrotheca closterium]
MSSPQEIPVPPAVIAIGLIGFLIALGAILHSKNKQNVKVKVAFDNIPSTPKSNDTTTGTDSSTGNDDAPSTPPRKDSTSTPTDKNTGSIQTPAGRRSARLAKRRKED